jgi:hypothetical protein
VLFLLGFVWNRKSRVSSLPPTLTGSVQCSNIHFGTHTVCIHLACRLCSLNSVKNENRTASIKKNVLEATRKSALFKYEHLKNIVFDIRYPFNVVVSWLVLFI